MGATESVPQQDSANPPEEPVRAMIANQEEDAATEPATAVVPYKDPELVAVPPKDYTQYGAPTLAEGEWPTLLDEARDGVLLSLMIYVLSDLRQILRHLEQQQKQQQSEEEPSEDPDSTQPQELLSTRVKRVLELPASAVDVFDTYMEYRDQMNAAGGAAPKKDEIKSKNLRQSTTSEKALELYYAVSDLQEYQKVVESRRHILQETQLVAFSDDHADHDMVYSLEVRPAQRRITVVFRGSVTPQDWIQDAKNVMTWVRNPVPKDDHDKNDRNIPPQAAQIAIHLGFKEYLYDDKFSDESLGGGGSGGRSTGNLLVGAATGKGKEILRAHEHEFIQQQVLHTTTTQTKQPSHVPNQTQHNPQTQTKSSPPNNKCQEILQLCRQLCHDYPGYRLYITGHSLGGALAAIFAVEAASDPYLPKPVSLVNVAAPKPGNLDFCAALEALEHRGMLRYLRLTNERDSISKMPAVGLPKLFDILFHPGVLFFHTGVNLTLGTPHPLWRYILPGHAFHYGARSRQRGWHRLTLVDLYDMIFYSCPGMCLCALWAVLTWGYCGLRPLVEHSCPEYMQRLHRERPKLEQIYLNDLYNRRFQKQVFSVNLPKENEKNQGGVPTREQPEQVEDI